MKRSGDEVAARPAKIQEVEPERLGTIGCDEAGTWCGDLMGLVSRGELASGRGLDDGGRGCVN